MSARWRICRDRPGPRCWPWAARGGRDERDAAAPPSSPASKWARVSADKGFGVAVDHAGWHSTGVFGCLAAAAGAAAAMRPRRERRVANALGAAATQVGGLTGSFGTMAKPFHAGKAAMNGVLSAELAAGGFVPALTWSSRTARWRTALVQDAAHALPRADFGGGWELLRNTFKPYACCLLTHATIDAGRALAAQGRGPRRSRRSRPSSIRWRSIWPARRRRDTPLEGKFSTAYCAALALTGHAATQADFSARSRRRSGAAAH